MNTREIAYNALLLGMKEKAYLSSTLEIWQKQALPSREDFRLAQEISYGSMRMQRALHYIAEKLSTKEKLRLKRKEKALLYTALYQVFYMDRIPLYAITDESVAIAKKYCHASFSKYLNALLRNLPDKILSLPKGNDVKSISIRTSYPEFFVETLLREYGLETTFSILEEGNRSPFTTARYRGEKECINAIIQKPFPVFLVDHLEKWGNTREAYIQNTTPVFLMGELAKTMPKPPRNILDLCASPGGKALFAHDLYPEASLTVNDVSEKKLNRLRENLIKYEVEANYLISRGEEIQTDQRFDLIIIDAPCSNSGVLNKRCEARWRLSYETIHSLRKTQIALFQHAKKLLSPSGMIWYMTCSILPEENSLPAHENIILQKTVLPKDRVWDGGSASAVQVS